MTPEDMSLLHGLCFPARPWSAAEFTKLTAKPDVITIFDENRGLLLAQTVAPETEILTLAVAPEQRRKGIAGGLVEKLFRHEKALRLERCFLEVATDNAAAVALYAKLGFTEVGRRSGYYARRGGKAVDALIMARALT